MVFVVVEIYMWCVTGKCWVATTLQFLLGTHEACPALIASFVSMGISLRVLMW